MVISFAQRISRDWLWKVHLPWLAIKGKGDESLTEKESDMGGPNWIEILTTTRLEVCFTWRFEGLLGDSWISSRWISFHSPALKYLEILGNAFRATWPGNIIQMTLDDIWHQTPGVGQQRKYEGQGFQIRVPGTDSPFQYPQGLSGGPRDGFAYIGLNPSIFQTFLQCVTLECEVGHCAVLLWNRPSLCVVEYWESWTPPIELHPAHFQACPFAPCMVLHGAFVCSTGFTNKVLYIYYLFIFIFIYLFLYLFNFFACYDVPPWFQTPTPFKIKWGFV